MTDPARYYAELLRTITTEDVYRTARVMMAHIGRDNMISIDALAVEVYGEFDGEPDGDAYAAYMSSIDRRVRKCLETLVKDYHMPIGATSGKAGRWLCATREEVEETCADLQSRVDETTSRIHALRIAVLPAREPERVQQRGLWG